MILCEICHELIDPKKDPDFVVEDFWTAVEDGEHADGAICAKCRPLILESQEET